MSGLSSRQVRAGGLPVAAFGDDFKLAVHAQDGGEHFADGNLVFNKNNAFHESIIYQQ